MHRLFALLVMLIGASAALAQPSSVADFSEHGTVFGAYNFTARYDPLQGSADTNELYEGASTVVQNDRWVLTVWAEIGANTLVYRYRFLDKQTGFFTGYVSTVNAVGNPTDAAPSLGPQGTQLTQTNPATLPWVTRSGNFERVILPVNPPLTVAAPPSTREYLASPYRPSACFTTATSGGYDGVAIAVIQGVNIVVHFFRVDPNSLPPAGTQPVWIPDPDRSSVNVSSSTGNSVSPNVECLSTGEIIVGWIDHSAGSVGGGTTNGAQGGSDVYVRRFSQQFPTTPGTPVPGIQDAASPNSSVVNVSNSTTLEGLLSMTTNSANRIYCVWLSVGANSATVAGLGPNSGPLQRAANSSSPASNSDVYLRLIDLAPTQTLTLSSASNVSASNGLNWQCAPRVAFNTSLSQVAVIFADDTSSLSTSGVGGNANMFAKDSGGVLKAAREDIFLRIYAANLSDVNLINLTDSNGREAFPAVSSFGARGWAAGWTEILNWEPTLFFPSTQEKADARHTRITPQGAAQSFSAYPIEAGGTTSFNWTAISAIASRENGASVLSFVHTGTPYNPELYPNPIQPQPAPFGNVASPADLRVTGGTLGIDPQRPAGTNRSDLFIALGESTTGGGTGNTINFTRFEVNTGNAVDLAVQGQTPMNAEVSILNSNPAAVLTISQLTIAPPLGFVQAGGGPAFPITILPSSTQTIVVQFAVSDPTLVKAGVNTFEVSAQGSVSGVSTFGTINAAVPVVGVDGSIIGVGLSVQLNPTAITTGKNSNVKLTVTVSNGGQDPLKDLSFSGRLLSDFFPDDLAFKVFSPNPSGVEIAVGQSVTFTTDVTLSALANARLTTTQFDRLLELLAKDSTGTITAGEELELNGLVQTGYLPAVTVEGTQASAGATTTRSGTVTNVVSEPVFFVEPKGGVNTSVPVIINSDSTQCSLTDSNDGWFIILLAFIFGSMALFVRRRQVL